MVNHPRHYNRDGAIECIDEMEMIYGSESVMTFCLLSAHKYRYRAGLKNDGFEDLQKSDWYMRKYKELKEKIESDKSYTIGGGTITIPYSSPWTVQPTWQSPPSITCAGINNAK